MLTRIASLALAAVLLAAPVAVARTYEEVQAPRGEKIEDIQAPRGEKIEDIQAPRGQDAQAPRDRGQDAQAPRDQEVQAPR